MGGRGVGGVMLSVTQRSCLPRGGRSKNSLSLEGSIKNHINIHDVYQSKSRTRVVLCIANTESQCCVLRLWWVSMHWQQLLPPPPNQYWKRKTSWEGWPLLAQVCNCSRGLAPSEPAGETTGRRNLKALRYETVFRTGALEEQSSKHLKTHKGQNSRVTSPRWKDASRLTSQLKRNHPECF